MNVSRLGRSGLVLAALALLVSPLPLPAAAQPAPLFQASCGDLRQAIRDMGYEEGDFVTIAVVGELTLVQSDEALAYLGVCEAPDPQVLCVTYGTGGRQVGDTVVVTGTYIPRGPDHIQLDPCLHHLPE